MTVSMKQDYEAYYNKVRETNDLLWRYHEWKRHLDSILKLLKTKIYNEKDIFIYKKLKPYLSKSRIVKDEWLENLDNFETYVNQLPNWR